MQARLDALLSRVRTDRVSGAAEVAEYVAEGLADYVGHPDADASSVREFAFAAYRARRSMATLFVLLNGVLDELPDLAAVRRRAVDFMKEQRDADGLISEAFSSLEVPRDVLTISNSSTVAAALLAASKKRPRLRAVVMESRPGGEGKRMAERLSEAGIECEIIADSMVFEAARSCGCAVCGADCIVPGYLVNKVGTAALAHASIAAGIPLHSLASSEKIVGVDISDPVVRTKRQDGRTVRTQVFERVPLELVTDLVTDKGVLRPEDLEFPAGPYPLLA
jgi:translation initiation factor eIF-2B subunit delta